VSALKRRSTALTQVMNPDDNTQHVVFEVLAAVAMKDTDSLQKPVV
jgi:hypothetical protein